MNFMCVCIYGAGPSRCDGFVLSKKTVTAGTKMNTGYCFPATKPKSRPKSRPGSKAVSGRPQSQFFSQSYGCSRFPVIVCFAMGNSKSSKGYGWKQIEIWGPVFPLWDPSEAKTMPRLTQITPRFKGSLWQSPGGLNPNFFPKVTAVPVFPL